MLQSLDKLMETKKITYTPVNEMRTSKQTIARLHIILFSLVHLLYLFIYIRFKRIPIFFCKKSSQLAQFWKIRKPRSSIHQWRYSFLAFVGTNPIARRLKYFISEWNKRNNKIRMYKLMITKKIVLVFTNVANMNRYTSNKFRYEFITSWHILLHQKPFSLFSKELNK